MAKDLYIKAGSGGGGGGVPTTRILTINGTAQDLSADRTWSVGDMLTSTYDTDADGVVDSAERIQIVVRNSTGSTLTKGQIVYLSGATGNRPNALLAKADAEITSSKTIGMVIADIPNNTDGQIAVNGTLHDIDTSAFTAGDVLWLSATTAGGVVANTPPSEPNHTVFIGYVARAHPTQGRVVLAIQNGYELDELHGVKITSVANNDVLKYNSSTGLWENSNALSSKQDAITLTTTGTSGAATLVGSTLNIPQYATGGTILTGYANSIAIPNTNNVYYTLFGGPFAPSTSGGDAIGLYINGTPIPVAGTLSKFYVSLRSAQPALNTLTIKIRNHTTAADAITLTIAGGTAAGVYSNTITTASVSAGDRIGLVLTNPYVTGGGSSSQINGYSVYYAY